MSSSLTPRADSPPPPAPYQASDAVCAAHNKMRDAKDALKRGIDAMDRAAFLPFEYDYAIGQLQRAINFTSDAKTLLQAASLADFGDTEDAPIDDGLVTRLIDEERGVVRNPKGGA